MAAIWASRRSKNWEWGQEVGLQWVPKGKGVRYLGIQVGFHFPLEANFDKMLIALKARRQAHQLEHLPPLPGREDPGGELGAPSFHVVPGCVLESKSQDVQPGPRGREKLHMGWEGHQRQSEGKVGYPSPPNHHGRARDHQPKNPVRNTPSKAPHQGPCTRRRTLEGAPEAQSRPGQTPGPWLGPQHPGHKLAIFSPQTQKTTLLPVEERTRCLVERKAGSMQIRTD